MNSLHCDPVRSLLERLYAEAQRSDAVLLPKVRAHAQSLGGPLDDRSVAHMLDEAFIPVAPEVGRLLYLLVRARRPKVAVEFGTSLGLSAIHIAAALKDNGAGCLIATELHPGKAARAMEHLRAAGMDDWVELRQGDAFETLSTVAGIDFLLLDGWKALYLPLLRKLEPALQRGCLVVADDVRLMPEMLAPYLNYVRDPRSGYTSNELPLDDGIELSLRD